MTQNNPPEPPHSTDKWQLGAGGTVYAPEHPHHLHVPGFWDEVRISGQTYSKLLCLSFVLEGRADTPVGQNDEADKSVGPTLTELFPYLSYWYWYPDRIEARYYLVVREGLGYKQQAGVRVFMAEKRYIAPDGSLHCEISFDLLKQHPPELHVVAWGVDTTLGSPAGITPTNTAVASVDGIVVPQIARTPFMEILRTGQWNKDVETGGHALSAMHWSVVLLPDSPTLLHVVAAPR